MDFPLYSEFVISTGQVRFLYVAGFSWALYDWVITLGQEIDLIWKRPGARASKLHYAFARYVGLATIAMNMSIAANRGWSQDFCRSYFYAYSLIGSVNGFAVQLALLLRVYVMHNRSQWILVISLFLFACEIVAMLGVTVMTISTKGYTTIPGTWGCWGISSNRIMENAALWTPLAFETYLCALVLPPAFSYWKSSEQSYGDRLMNILIRDSFLWYIALASCLLANAVAWSTGTIQPLMFGIAVVNAIYAVGGPRLLLNLRAVYFSPLQGTDRSTDLYRGTDLFDTVGTVGKFWSPISGSRGTPGEDDECTASISMGVWSNRNVQRNAPPSPPPTIMLKPIHSTRREPSRRPESGSLLAEVDPDLAVTTLSDGEARQSRRVVLDGGSETPSSYRAARALWIASETST